ncbi:MAG: hypothetical protein INR73_26125 [Williamsia sp.]|nr:hypothetical protein [Williamsia sp.]
MYTEEGTTISKTDSPLINFITRPYCDTIYKLIKDSLVPAYQLVLPRENFQRNNAWLFRHNYNFYETPRLFFFTIRYFSNFESYIYQKQSNITYKTRNVKPDNIQYNLQLLADYGTLRKGDKYYKA